MYTIVSFELAKLLKEKGFDVPTNNYYEHALTSKKDSETNDYTGAFGWKKGETNLSSGYFKNNYDMTDLSSKNWYICSAPTIAEVIMWFLEKYGIWIYARQVRNPEPLPNYWCGIINKDAKLIDSVEGFYSPSSAYEAAIEYTLKNLIP